MSSALMSVSLRPLIDFFQIDTTGTEAWGDIVSRSIERSHRASIVSGLCHPLRDSSAKRSLTGAGDEDKEELAELLASPIPISDKSNSAIRKEH